MFALERQKRILELLGANGAVWVSKLSSELGVTEETVRRDLEKLEAQGMLVRTHGGAVPVDNSSYDLSLEVRKTTNTEAKELLAKEAVKHVNPGDTIFLDSSTTTFFMSKELKKMKDVTVITNSIRIVNELASQEGIQVISVGGRISDNQSFVGSLAESNVRNNYFASKIFFSSKGLSKEAGILESNEQECAIKQRMIENCKKRYYLCDKTKIGRIGFVKLAPLESIDFFITEADLDEKWQNKLNELNVEVIKI